MTASVSPPAEQGVSQESAGDSQESTVYIVS